MCSSSRSTRSSNRSTRSSNRSTRSSSRSMRSSSRRNSRDSTCRRIDLSASLNSENRKRCRQTGSRQSTPLFGKIKWGVFRRGGFSNNSFVLKPDVAIASKVSILSKNSLALTDFQAKKTQHVQLFENPLPGTPTFAIPNLSTIRTRYGNSVSSPEATRTC